VKFNAKALQGLAQLLLVIAVIAGALYLSSSLAPQTDKARAPISMLSQNPGVRTETPNLVDFQPVVTLSGVVENRTRTDIASQVGGRVIHVSPNFATGAAVRRGELLFMIDQADYRLALETTGAEIAAAKGDLQQLRIAADLSIREWRETYPDREVPPLAAKAPQIAAAEARLLAAEASRKKAELALERTTVRAPFDARILETQLDEGQIVNPNQIVGAVFALASIEIAAAISAAETRMISPTIGRSARIHRPGFQGEVGQGVIVRTDAQVDARTRLGRLFLATDGSADLTVGEFVNVVVQGDLVSGAMELPASALTGRDTVWVVSGERLSRRQVVVLSDAGEGLVVAPFDVADGVVLLPPPEPTEGLEVRILVASPEQGELADGR